MGYYSFVAIASQEVHFPQHLVSLDQGVNVFTAVLEDVNTFQKELQDAGVLVQRCFQLSEELEPRPAPRLTQEAEYLSLPVKFQVGAR